MPVHDKIEALMQKAEEASALCQAFGNARRLLILCHLLQGPLNVSEIGALIPDISQSALSQHLKVLKEEGLVAAQKESQLCYYSLSSPSAEKLLTLLKEIFCP